MGGARLGRPPDTNSAVQSCLELAMNAAGSTVAPSSAMVEIYYMTIMTVFAIPGLLLQGRHADTGGMPLA